MQMGCGQMGAELEPLDSPGEVRLARTFAFDRSQRGPKLAAATR